MNKKAIKAAYMAGMVHTIIAIVRDITPLDLLYQQWLIDDFDKYITKNLENFSEDGEHRFTLFSLN